MALQMGRGGAGRGGMAWRMATRNGNQPVRLQCTGHPLLALPRPCAQLTGGSGRASADAQTPNGPYLRLCLPSPTSFRTPYRSCCWTPSRRRSFTIHAHRLLAYLPGIPPSRLSALWVSRG